MLVDILKALADDNRLRILNALIKGELCVCEIEEILDMSQSNVSRHLTKLKTAGIITSRKSSQWMYYKIDDDFIKENKDLYNYLCKEMKNSKLFQLDSMRMMEDKASGFSCENLTKDKIVKETILNK